MCDGALAFVPQESFGHRFAKRAVGLAAPGTCCVTSCEVCGLKLVILRCRTIQLVDRQFARRLARWPGGSGTIDPPRTVAPTTMPALINTRFLMTY
jgi:hypothetical protein